MTSNHEHPVFRNGLITKAGTKHRTSDELPSFASQYIPFLPPNPADSHQTHSASTWNTIWLHNRHRLADLIRLQWRRAKRWDPRSILNLRLVFVALWMVILWWSEEVVFDKSVEACSWDKWETWGPTANPHRIALIADPQLVDPHTYPGRPWPLSSLTIRYTDLYIEKSFQRISNVLLPDTVFFLGDLFDGGREWSNDPTFGATATELESKEIQWRSYRQGFWMQEYYRFGRIFFDTWRRSHPERSRQAFGRRLIVDLPGNHDLGLGGGIRVPARRRFNVFFGQGNRIDVIGNHTFVSVDTVSLSAKGQIDVDTGTQGILDDAHIREVWEPADEFLHNANTAKARAIERTLRAQKGLAETEAQEPTVYDLEDPLSRTLQLRDTNGTDFPSIILTHVPLHRPPGTPCGPLREHFPPSKKINEGETLEKDEPNAIPYQAGNQYQNVLTPAVSSEIVDLVGDVSHAFSGDDHDYCDVTHREYTSKHGGIREITVKSISWAMGVRHPGFLLVSLWNPVDEHGKAIGSEAAKQGTLQTHLCILPDQLSIFIRYVLLFMLTLVALFVNAYRSSRGGRDPSDSKMSEPLLPITRKDSPNSLSQDSGHAQRRSEAHVSSQSFSSSTSEHRTGLAPRTAATGRASSRSTSPGWGIPPDEVGVGEDAAAANWKDVDLNGTAGTSTSSRRRRASSTGRIMATFWIFQRDLAQVALFVLTWYLYLLWTS